MLTAELPLSHINRERIIVTILNLASTHLIVVYHILVTLKIITADPTIHGYRIIASLQYLTTDLALGC
jgi:hypothetical protein